MNMWHRKRHNIFCARFEKVVEKSCLYFVEIVQNIDKQKISFPEFSPWMGYYQSEHPDFTMLARHLISLR